MDDKLLHLFRRLISRKTGIVVRTEDLTALEKCISARIALLRLLEPVDYLRLLSGDTYVSRCEWKELIIPLTIGESFFFPDKGQFEVLKERILPELIEKRKDVRSLRIWSAGCSRGEEPYSLAILLDGLLPDRRDWNISIVGTDINEDTLGKARLGAYTQWSFRMVEQEVQGRYFKRRRDEWEIDERIRNMVTFSYGNLIEEAFPNHEICNMDLIMCRNVFIYFKELVLTQAQLYDLNTKLEEKVKERTAALKAEIEQRKATEESLKKSDEELRKSLDEVERLNRLMVNGEEGVQDRRAEEGE
ncbi:MAG: CheR family methyltransferase [Deltaproteobacteria bacterium]